jgi:hypothetical protein
VVICQEHFRSLHRFPPSQSLVNHTMPLSCVKFICSRQRRVTRFHPGFDPGPICREARAFGMDLPVRIPIRPVCSDP